MAGPDPAVAAVRRAVRLALDDTAAGSLVVAACSGGADSLALLAGLAWEAPRAGRGSGVVHVDHGLQPGSAVQAQRVVDEAKRLGVEVVEVVSGTVTRRPGESPEAAARRFRYQALDEAAGRTGAVLTLLGHTRDDQAESVLLGLVRGSGARSLAGMPERRPGYRRPLLGVSRRTTEAACAALGLAPWADPANDDPAYRRNRVRHRVLPVLERELGPGVAEALARTADLLRTDADLLDVLADQAAEQCLVPGTGPAGPLRVAALRTLPDALRGRVLRRWVVAAGAPPGDLSAVHVAALDRLVDRWHGQGPVALPGGLAGLRRCDTLRIDPRPGDGGLVPDDEIESVLISEKEIQTKIEELAAEISRDYAGREVLLIGVLKGAFMLMADLARAITVPVTLDFMAVSSYGSSTSTSGVVRILKDLDRDIAGRHLLIVEDVIDSGLTLNYLLRNLRSRGPASLEVCALLRKPEAAQVEIPVRYAGFDLPSVFVVGYGLDYGERYRTLPYIGTLRPEAYQR